MSINLFPNGFISFVVFLIRVFVYFMCCRFWTARARARRVCFRCPPIARARVLRRIWRARCSGASRAASRALRSCRSSLRRAFPARPARARVRGSSPCASSCSTACFAGAPLRRPLRLAIRGIHTVCSSSAFGHVLSNFLLFSYVHYILYSRVFQTW